jgi:alpha-1,2-mannosyltransferase
LSLVFEPLRTNTTYGQINAVLLLLIVIDLTSSPDRIRGGLVGLAGAIKLTPLVYLLYFAIKGAWRSLFQGLLTFIGIGLVAFAILPSDSRTYWLHQVFDPSRTGTVGGRRNQSWYGLVHRWPFPAHWAVLSWSVLSMVTLGAAILLVHRLVLRDRIIDAVVALGMCAELISPISWSHHWVWIVLLPVLLVRGFRGQPLVTASMILLCVVGAIGPYAWDFHGGPGRGLDDTLVLAGALALLTWTISEVRILPIRPGVGSEGRTQVASQHSQTS